MSYSDELQSLRAYIESLRPRSFAANYASVKKLEFITMYDDLWNILNDLLTVMGDVEKGKPYPPDKLSDNSVLFGEGLGVGNGTSGPYTLNCSNFPVVGATFKITTIINGETCYVQDDGNGNLLGNVDPTASNKINYLTGVAIVTFSGPIALGVSINSNYKFHKTTPLQTMLSWDSAGGNVDGHRLYKKIVGGGFLHYNTETVGFTVGDVVTGGTSHAFGTIIFDDNSGATGILYIIAISGNFSPGETITDPDGGSATADADAVRNYEQVNNDLGAGANSYIDTKVATGNSFLYKVIGFNNISLPQYKDGSWWQSAYEAIAHPGNISVSFSDVIVYSPNKRGTMEEGDLYLEVSGADADPLQVELDVKINGTSIFSVKPVITKAAANKSCTNKAGAGITVGVIDTTKNKFNIGDRVSIDLNYTGASPVTPPAGAVVFFEYKEGDPSESSASNEFQVDVP